MYELNHVDEQRHVKACWKFGSPGGTAISSFPSRANSCLGRCLRQLQVQLALLDSTWKHPPAINKIITNTPNSRQPDHARLIDRRQGRCRSRRAADRGQAPCEPAQTPTICLLNHDMSVPERIGTSRKQGIDRNALVRLQY